MMPGGHLGFLISMFVCDNTSSPVCCGFFSELSGPTAQLVSETKGHLISVSDGRLTYKYSALLIIVCDPSWLSLDVFKTCFSGYTHISFPHPSTVLFCFLLHREYFFHSPFSWIVYWCKCFMRFGSIHPCFLSLASHSKCVKVCFNVFVLKQASVSHKP